MLATPSTRASAPRAAPPRRAARLVLAASPSRSAPTARAASSAPAPPVAIGACRGGASSARAPPARRTPRPHSARVVSTAGSRRAAVVARAGPPDEDDASSSSSSRRSPFDRPAPRRLASPRFSREAQTWALLGGVATSLTVLVTLAVAANDEAAYFGGAWEGDFAYMGDDFTGGASPSSLTFFSLSPGAALAAVVWAVGLFFKSPLQILLVFLGRTDTERPSDWLLRVFDGDERVKTFEDASGARRAAIVAFFAACGLGAVAAFDWAFAGEETWGLSAGVGFAMLSLVAELGSPERYTSEELDALEARYADFCAFADESLRRGGRCHSTEIERAFKRSGAGRGAGEVSEKELYAMILNWHPDCARTANGYFKNLSLKEGVDKRNPVTVKDLGL